MSKKLFRFFIAACWALTGLVSAMHADDNMPAFKPGDHILFQGNSITDGNCGRSPDPNHILGHGYVSIIAAKYGAMFPERHLLPSLIAALVETKSVIWPVNGCARSARFTVLPFSDNHAH